MVYNKIYAQLGEERHIVLDPINYQYDIKQILVISGETAKYGNVILKKGVTPVAP